MAISKADFTYFEFSNKQKILNIIFLYVFQFWIIGKLPNCPECLPNMDCSKLFESDVRGKMKWHLLLLHRTYWFLYFLHGVEKLEQNLLHIFWIVKNYFENLRESLRLYQIVIPASNPPHLLNRYLPENVIY